MLNVDAPPFLQTKMEAKSRWPPKYCGIAVCLLVALGYSLKIIVGAGAIICPLHNKLGVRPNIGFKSSNNAENNNTPSVKTVCTRASGIHTHTLLLADTFVN